MAHRTGQSGKQRSGVWPVLGAAFVVVLAVVGAASLIRPLPPRSVVMATGPADEDFAIVGERYKEYFARHGVRLELLSTNGAVENLELLRDTSSGVSVAFVQDGLTDAEQSPGLISLGTMWYRPFWILTRVPLTDGRGEFIRDRAISFGKPGSGTHALAIELSGALGLDLESSKIKELSAPEAERALASGEIDAAAIVGAWRTPVVQRLLTDDEIQIVDWERADAHVALRPYLSKLVLPRGVADLAKDKPPEDLTLVATKTSLVVREDMHQAIQYLLLEAAAEIHGTPSVFQRAGDFPAAEPVDLPLSEFARQYHRSGRPFLHRYLPFWLAVLSAQLLVLLIPILGVLYPVFRLLPALYAWGMRRRIFVLYRDLKFFEQELELRDPNEPIENLSARLDKIEHRANHMRAPTAFTHMLYTLRHHISLVRERVDRLIDPPPSLN